jgi:hypothetical protein
MPRTWLSGLARAVLGLAFAAVLGRFLWAPGWPEVAALGVVGLALVLDAWRHDWGVRARALETRCADLERELAELKPRLTQVLNRPAR